MVKHKKLGMAVAGACALFGASAANAFGPIKAGDWDLSVGGEVNAFYSYTHCDNNNNTITGGAVGACTTTNTKSSSSVRSGLLPSALVFSAKTTQEGFDIGVTFGFYPGINSSHPNAINANGPGIPIGLGTTGIDMRQNFLTFGDKDMGTIKMGRDLGFFGSDAILSDITLLGVGSGGAAAPGNTSLGRIGFGYIYADWDPQISIISPASLAGVSGLQGSIGIFQPYDAIGFNFNSATLTAHQMPGVQGKLTYDYDVGGVTGRAWGGFFYQKFDSEFVGVSGASGYAGDLGIKASIAGFEPVIYYYQARGVGTTAFGFDGIDLAGNKRNSNGGYVQLAYKMGKWKPGVSYGMSRLALASDESTATNPILLHRNRSAVAQLQYSLTKALTLVGEYVYTKTNSQLGGPGGVNQQGTFSLGAILFF